MDFELQNELQDAVAHNERLLWAGKPKTGVLFRPSDTFLIPFSILWCGFAIFWESMALQAGSLLFIIFGIPFVLVGLYITIGRFFADSMRRKNTIYGITTGRVIIKSGIFNKELKSINIKNITDLTLTEKPDGSGTILFGPSPAQRAVAFNTGNTWQGSKVVNGLEFVEEARKVYNILVQAQKE